MPNLLALQKYSLGDSDFYYKNKDRQNIEEYGGDKSFFVMVYEPFEKYGIQFGGWKIEFHFERDIFTVWNMNLTLFINKKFNLNHALSYWRPQLLKKFEKPFELRLVVPFLNFNIYQKIFYLKKSFQTFSYFLNGKSCMQHIISCKTARHTKMTLKLKDLLGMKFEKPLSIDM